MINDSLIDIKRAVLAGRTLRNTFGGNVGGGEDIFQVALDAIAIMGSVTQSGREADAPYAGVQIPSLPTDQVMGEGILDAGGHCRTTDGLLAAGAVPACSPPPASTEEKYIYPKGYGPSDPMSSYPSEISVKKQWVDELASDSIAESFGYSRSAVYMMIERYLASAIVQPTEPVSVSLKECKLAARKAFAESHDENPEDYDENCCLPETKAVLTAAGVPYHE